MSASTKRTCKDEMDDPLLCKKNKNVPDTKIASFMAWCLENDLKLSEKVKISRENVCAQYGMVTLSDINEGECLFEIPRHRILTPEASGITKVLMDDAEDLKSPSGWVPLLISVMYEYGLVTSPWRAYLDICPDFEHLDQPMFWDRCELETLQGTGVIEAVTKDLQSISKEFKDIVLPFIIKHKEHFSFTEPEKQADHEEDSDVESGDETLPDSKPFPMMVPVADILNHIADNNAHLVFEKESLKMVAIKSISKGCEVFNTYGMLANWQLLHMYGFAEEHPHNHYDTVDIPMKNLYDAAKDLLIHKDDSQLLEEKWEFLTDLSAVTNDGSFIAGYDGILTEEEMYQTLKVLVMTRNELTLHKEKEGWSDGDDDDDDKTSLSADRLYHIPETWKVILMKSVQETKNKFKTLLEQDQEEYKANISKLSSRQKYSLFTLIGQKTLLQRLCFLILVNKGNSV